MTIGVIQTILGATLVKKRMNYTQLSVYALESCTVLDYHVDIVVRPVSFLLMSCTLKASPQLVMMGIHRCICVLLCVCLMNALVESRTNIEAKSCPKSLWS